MFDLLRKFIQDRSAKQLGTTPVPGETDMYAPPGEAHEKSGLVPPLLIALILSLLLLARLSH